MMNLTNMIIISWLGSESIFQTFDDEAEVDVEQILELLDRPVGAEASENAERPPTRGAGEGACSLRARAP
jgi:hypothetical protein